MQRGPATAGDDRPGVRRGRAAADAGAGADRETGVGADEHRALRLWLRLLTCTGLIERRIRTRLRERFATTLPRFDLMARLQRHPEGLKMNEISRLMMVTGGNVTGIVDQLAQEGLVERIAEPADRRAFRVRLTPQGERGFAAMATEHEGWIVELVSGLTRQEHAELYRLLARLKQHCIDNTSSTGKERA